MKKTGILILLTLVCLACQKKGTQDDPSPSYDKAELEKACRYAQGGGAAATGGAGGSVIYVTMLTDEIDKGTGIPMGGTLRYAAEYQSGARVILFNVSGTIHLKSPLNIKNSHITIAGQSAPGDGICVADYPIIIQTNDVVLRFIRCRLGNESLKIDPTTDYDALTVNNSKGVLIDHCSFSWSVDECVSCYGNENFTLQYCFITESLRNAGHVKGAHGYGGIWGGKNASFHHNLLAHHDSRNPRFDHDYVNITCAGPIDFVNNVIYNWGNNSSYGGEGSSKGAGGRHINMVNNYYKYGPSTNTKVRSRVVDPWTSCSNCTSAKDGRVEPGGTLIPPVIFLSGNYMFDSEEVTADNWKGATHSDKEIVAASRWTDGLTALTDEQTALAAYETVLAKAGCSLSRDAVDLRLVEEVRNGTGKLIDKPADVGGWPDLKEGTVPQDSDGDGIPDEWEIKYGLDPHKYSDGQLCSLVDNVHNIDVYLNYIVKDLY